MIEGKRNRNNIINGTGVVGFLLLLATVCIYGFDKPALLRQML